MSNASPTPVRLSATEPRHPIRVVARRAGLSVHLLRAWERRYGVVAPARSEGGQRLYSDADVERLRLLREAVEAGRPISQVADLPTTELAVLVATDHGPDGHDLLAHRLGECLAAAERLDTSALDLALMQGMVSVAPIDFCERLVTPLLREVGDRWHRGALSPTHEQGVSASVRRALTFMLASFRPLPGAPTAIVTTLPGETHEFGALLAAIRTAETGWRPLYMGPDLGPERVAELVAANEARAVAVSAVAPRRYEDLVPALEAIRKAVPTDVAVIAGGRGMEAYEEALESIDGVEVHGLRALPGALAEIWPGGVGS